MDEGYFPRGGSMLRRVMEERVVGLFYGQRALMIGALHPVNYVGTSQATAGRERPFRRLARTAKDFETVFFGTTSEANRVLGKVARLHERVVGTLPFDAGPYPAGTPYSATDADLMLWTVAVTADSALCFYELFVRRLSASERDSFWRDWIRFGELFGMDRAVAPPTYEAFRAWWDGRMSGGDLHLTDEARYMGHAAAFEIPMPAVNQPVKRLHDLVMLGSLPPRVRELYGLSYGPLQAAAFAGAVAAVRGLRLAAPRAVTHGRNDRSFSLVAATERGRLARRRPTPQLPPLAERTAPEAPAEAAVPARTPTR